jgi:hypothetical protein
MPPLMTDPSMGVCARVCARTDKPTTESAGLRTHSIPGASSGLLHGFIYQRCPAAGNGQITARSAQCR